MRCRRVLLWLAVPGVLAMAGAAHAGEVLELCFSYGCNETVPVRISEPELAVVAQRFATVDDAAREREAVALAVGDLYGLAGGQTPVFMDRGGNYADDEAHGRMDCIDHSTTTTRMLALMARRGWLRFHEVAEPARRARVFTQHFSARLRERAATEPVVVARPAADPGADPGADAVAVMLALCDCPEVAEDAPQRPVQGAATDVATEGSEYVVDSWFRDNGAPAVVLPLAEWMNGEGPDVE